ncbi:MAG: glucose-1-phosphate adenylyltransferase [Ferruginibacter sp.]
MYSKKVVAVDPGRRCGNQALSIDSNPKQTCRADRRKVQVGDIPISNCINSNINRIFVLTQYNSASLNKHIKNTYQFSGFSSGFVDILAAEQTPESMGWFQGTADAVRQSLKHIQNNDFDYVLILSGDQLYQMDFTEMLDNHVNNGADISIATIPVGEREAPEFGILKAGEDNLIHAFIEKPSKEKLPAWISNTGEEMLAQGRVYLASMGIYIFNRKLLFDLLQVEKPDATDFGKEIIPGSIDQQRVVSYQYDGYWTDIGNIYSFFEANLALTLDIPPFNLFDNKKMVYSRARMLPPAKISGTTIEQAIIAEGCIIHASKISNSVIGIRSRIGSGSEITSCYVMGSDFYETIEEIAYNFQKGIPKIGIGDNCHLTNVILDKDCRVGNNVSLKGGSHLPDGDHALFTIKDGIVVVKKGAIIPDGFQL